MKKVLFLVLSILVIGCSTCFAMTLVQMNDNFGAGGLIERYNHLAGNSSLDMNNCLANELRYIGQDSNYDAYGSQCRNNNLILFQCNKAGYVVGCMITGPDRNTVIKETLVMMTVITNYEQASETCKQAVSNSFTNGSTQIWYSNNMNRYYCINVNCINGLYRATLIAVVQ